MYGLSTYLVHSTYLVYTFVKLYSLRMLLCIRWHKIFYSRYKDRMTHTRHIQLTSESKLKCPMMDQIFRVSALQWKKLHTGPVLTNTVYILCMYYYKSCTSQHFMIFTRAWWEIEVCLVHVDTNYHKYRPSMYSVHTQYKPSILTYRSTPYFLYKTDRYALMYRWKKSCNIWSVGENIIPRKPVLSPASTYWYILSQILVNFVMYVLCTYQPVRKSCTRWLRVTEAQTVLAASHRAPSGSLPPRYWRSDLRYRTSWRSTSISKTAISYTPSLSTFFNFDIEGVRYRR